VSGRKPQPVLASAGEDVLDGGRHEILELVDHEIEVAPGLLAHVLAAHGGLVKLSDDEASQERGVFFSDRALRKFREKDALAVEDLAEIEAALALREHGAKRLRTQEAVEPSEDRSRGFANEKRELSLPVVDDLLVLDRLQEVLPVIRLDEEAAQVMEAAAVCGGEKRLDGVREHGLHLVAP